MSKSKEKDIDKLMKKGYELKIYRSIFNFVKNSSCVLIYSFIYDRANKKGYCEISDADICKIFALSEKKIQRILKSLEKQGAIYRNTWHFPGGCRRHLIARDNAKKYFDSFLSRELIDQSVRDHYISSFLNTKPENYIF